MNAKSVLVLPMSNNLGRQGNNISVFFLFVNDVHLTNRILVRNCRLTSYLLVLDDVGTCVQEKQLKRAMFAKF